MKKTIANLEKHIKEIEELSTKRYYRIGELERELKELKSESSENLGYRARCVSLQEENNWLKDLVAGLTKTRRENQIPDLPIPGAWRP